MTTDVRSLATRPLDSRALDSRALDSRPLSCRPVDPARDAPLVQGWLRAQRAAFWQMTDLDVPQVEDYLGHVDADPAQHGWIVVVDGAGRAYVETYDPRALIPSSALDPQPGDVGMHLLIGPPDDAPEHGFTARMMAAVLRFCFLERGAARVVVEPDVRNAPILAKNAAAGFRVLREVELGTGDHAKRAALSVCTREDFAASPLGDAWPGEGSTHDATPAPPDPLATPTPHRHLVPTIADTVHRHLLAKALAEFSHERILHPAAAEDGRFEVAAPGSDGLRVRFRARVLPLEHWLVEEDSLVCDLAGEQVEVDVLAFVAAFQEVLEVPDALLSTYLEELSSTFAAACAKLEAAHAGLRPTSTELLDANLPRIEAAMTEGHPGFLAGSGRIGFSLTDYRAYAPEQGERTRLHWVAARRELSHLALGEGLEEQDHLELALSPEERDAFDGRLRSHGEDPSAFHLLPLHPWQAEHRLPITFAPDIARGDLIPLGPGGDEHQPQQSLRTFLNRTRQGAPYVKVALAIQNMGFLRGLSPHYMRDTPAINDWIAGVVGTDPEFAARGFSLLRERSSLGYTGDVYHRAASSSPHRRMLAALWRESPLPLLGPGERAMTMASLLHRDHEGTSYAATMIRASGIPSRDWLREYLEAYLRPLVHALLGHDVVFMPHGENLILRVREQRIVGAFMKDIGEEMAVVGPRELPADIERIRARVPGEEKALSIFTDVFDGVLRHLSGILEADGLLPSRGFWQIVAEVLDDYEAEHPDLARGLAGDVDLRSGSFAHSCLNRLQLRNTLQMVDLGDQAESLLYAGEMPNPVARGARQG